MIRKSATSAKPQQKVILVQKRPAKAIRIDSDDDDDDYMERPAEKCVSFSEEDEVVLIAARKSTPLNHKPKSPNVNDTKNVRHRLGKTATKHLVHIFDINNDF